jgi:hypothetical protein
VEPNDITLRQLQDLRNILHKRNDMKLADYIIHKRDGVGQIHRALSILMTPFSHSNNNLDIEEQTQIRHQRTIIFFFSNSLQWC